MDVSFAVIVVQASDVALVTNLIVALEALDVLPLFFSVCVHRLFLFLVLLLCREISLSPTL